MFFDKKVFEAMTEKQRARYQKSMIFNTILHQLINDYMASYKIGGLLPSMSERVIKESFLFNAQCVFFTKSDAVLSLYGGGTADLNIYGDFKNANVYGKNGYAEEVSLFIPGGIFKPLQQGLASTFSFSNAKGVLVRENQTLLPFIQTVIMFAEAIADTYQTLDVTRQKIKRPFVFVVPYEDRASVEDYVNRAMENERYVVISPKSKVADPSTIRVLPFNVGGDDIKAATQLIEWYYTKYYELLGIDTNSNPDKAAQISVAEVQSNNALIELQMQKRLNCIREGFDFVNEIFGTSLTVERTVDFSQQIADNGSSKEVSTPDVDIKEEEDA